MVPSPAGICLNMRVGSDQKDWTEIGLIRFSPGLTEETTGVAETGRMMERVEEGWPVWENEPHQGEHCLP